MNSVKLVSMTTGKKIVDHFEYRSGKEINMLATDVALVTKNQIYNHVKLVLPEESEYWGLLEKPDRFVAIVGKLRSYNHFKWGKRILDIYVSPHEVILTQHGREYKNHVQAIGQVVKEVKFKERANGLVVAETMLKIQRSYDPHRFDYLPIVGFEENAHRMKRLKFSQVISMDGRIHSRDFMFKYTEQGISKRTERTAYELAVHNMDICSNEAKNPLHQ